MAGIRGRNRSQIGQLFGPFLVAGGSVAPAFAGFGIVGGIDLRPAIDGTILLAPVLDADGVSIAPTILAKRVRLRSTISAVIDLQAAVTGTVKLHKQ